MLLVIGCNVCESQNCGSPFKTIIVSQSSNASFKTIQSAIDFVPSENSQWIHIQISPGVYREQVVIPINKPCIFLQGAGRNSTSIEWGDHGNATFYTKANNTIAKGITFTNTLNKPIILEDTSTTITQAKAARIHADKCVFFDCAFLGVQDTLYDDDGRHYYSNCYIQGGSDFIYGNGQSIFENCNITGAKGKTMLGRSLRPYARVIIAYSFLSNVVTPQGWSARTFVGHEGNITFVEEGNRGPGANKSKRVKWMKHLSGLALDQFLNISYIDEEGWIAELPPKIFI
ncbi:hypothetical protein JHK82_023617 [Glycine max]|nr:hypothetical protein JHK82_023617 [Glycine max]